jgi:hypothetical protein
MMLQVHPDIYAEKLISVDADLLAVLKALTFLAMKSGFSPVHSPG